MLNIGKGTPNKELLKVSKRKMKSLYVRQKKTSDGLDVMEEDRDINKQGKSYFSGCTRRHKNTFLEHSRGREPSNPQPTGLKSIKS